MPDLDHREMAPPFLREIHRTQICGYLGIWDFRVSPPNAAPVPSAIMHSLEHFLDDQLRAKSDAVLLVAPMGCGTGFYIVSTVADFDTVAWLVRDALSTILLADEVPLANDIQCGRAEHHTLKGAQHVARYLVDRYPDWRNHVISPHAESNSSARDRFSYAE